MATQRAQDIADGILKVSQNGRVWRASALSIEPSNGKGLSDYGILPSSWVRVLDIDAPSLVIRSYATPIAWRAASGTWRVPSERYSVTTSKHQGRVRAAINLLGHQQREDDAIQQALDLVS